MKATPTERLEMSSKRRLQKIVDELVAAGLVRIERLRERGNPCVIIPITSEDADETPD